MNLVRIIKIVGFLFGVLIIFLIARSILTDDSPKINLDRLIKVNTQLVDISNDAKNNLDNFEMANAAANIATVIASDNNLFMTYYQNNHGRPLREARDAENPLEKLRQSSPGGQYQDAYIDLAKDLRAQAQTLAQDLSTTGTSEFKELLDIYRQHLDELFADL